MRISEQLRVLAVTAMIANLSACAAATAVRPAGPIPTGAAPAIPRIVGVLEAQDRALASFRAQAKLDYSSPQQSFKSTQVVVVRAPSSARIDVMNPFGVSYTVATDGKHLSAYDRRQSVYYHGLAQAESFRKFIGIPMSAGDFADVLRGLPPGVGVSRWSAVVAAEGGWLVRRRLGSGGVLELVVDSNSLLPVRVKISGDRDRHEMTVAYSDYRDVTGVMVPFVVEVGFKDGTRLDIAYKSVQRGVVLSEAAFRVDKPAGSRVVNIDTEGAGGT